MSIASRLFSTYQGGKSLEQTGIEDIPENERAAYWAFLGAKPTDVLQLDDYDALHQIWLEEQQRRRKPNKVLVHLAGGGVHRIYHAQGMDVEVIVLDEDELLAQDQIGDLHSMDFIYRATELLRPVNHDKIRRISPRDPIA